MTTDGKMGWNLDNSYANLPNSFFDRTNPSPVTSPQLVILNQSLATELGLEVQELQSKEGIAMLSGNQLPYGALPLAQAYAGHQFGHFTMLGDGRAVLLGEQITPKGERFDIQLKGSGKTPYSRSGDGRAVLGPMLREYIISEAMHSLGIATTRSLAVVKTGEAVMREAFQPGAVLARVASSHLRVGTFQYAAARGNIGELRALADYTIRRHFSDGIQEGNPYLALLYAVIKRQALLISQWQLVGFVHGVMNTDNMAISGETIDYGPCAFMDVYDEATVFSSIDTNGRYAYGNQPDIAGWNLARFAETLLPLLHEIEEEAIQLAQKALEHFSVLYHQHWLYGMRHKLGLFNQEDDDELLVKELLAIMAHYRADFTNTFRALTLDILPDNGLANTPEYTLWYDRWRTRVHRQPAAEVSFQQLMQQNNPAVIPRNHRVEEALMAANEGDFSVMRELLKVISQPYVYSDEQVSYANLPEPSMWRYRTYCGT